MQEKIFTKLPEHLKQYARTMRHDATDAESFLWLQLRDRRFGGFKFRRQHPIGAYILDFYCHAERLVVELDGGQHNVDAKIHQDEVRTQFLTHKGLRVLRYWNHDLLNAPESVLEHLWQQLHGQTPSPPTPLPQGEGR